MKIGHFAHYIWGPGGVGTYLRTVGRAQLDAGHDVRFFTDVAGGAGDPRLEAATTTAPGSPEVFARAASLKLDIIHLHTALDMPSRPPVPAVRTVHGHQPYCPSSSRYLARSAAPCERAYTFCGCLHGHLVERCGSIRPRSIVRNLAATRRELHDLRGLPLITASDFVRQQLIRSGYEDASIRIIPLPVPHKADVRPPPRSEPVRVAFLGRITAPKGVDWLLRAAATVPGRLCLDIAGDGAAADSMRALAVHLGLEERVTFRGWLREADVLDVMNGARAVVVPSTWHEPAGFVALEAMACRRAVVASRVGGLPEAVTDGVHGLLVDCSDIGALAAALTCMAGDWEMAERMGAAGLEKVRREHTVEAHLGQLEFCYHEAVRGHAAPTARATVRAAASAPDVSRSLP